MVFHSIFHFLPMTHTNKTKTCKHRAQWKCTKNILAHQKPKYNFSDIFIVSWKCRRFHCVYCQDNESETGVKLIYERGSNESMKRQWMIIKRKYFCWCDSFAILLMIDNFFGGHEQFFRFISSLFLDDSVNFSPVITIKYTKRSIER